MTGAESTRVMGGESAGVIEREGILCGKLVGADTGVTLADIGADGCVSSSSKSENS